MSDRLQAKPKPLLAFFAAIPIVLLGGLIGLGGAEFRLPVLAGPLRYAAKQAVPLAVPAILIGAPNAKTKDGMRACWSACRP